MSAFGWPLVAVCCLLLSPGAVTAAEVAASPATVCIECHEGQEGRLAAPVALWRASVHAQNGISCHSCHGGDPNDFALAMSPEKGFLGAPENDAIPDFCGRCHVGVREDYLASAHGQALGQGGPQCVTCHGNHGVQRASLDLINAKDCSRCHEFDRAEQIKSAMVQIDGQIGGLETRLQALYRIGIATRTMEDGLFALRNDFHRLFHNVDVGLVRQETQGFQQRLDQLQGEVAVIDVQLAWRKKVGAVAVGLLLLAGVVLLLVRKTYQEEEHS